MARASFSSCRASACTTSLRSASEGQRASFVEDDGVDATKRIQMHPALDDRAEARRTANPAEDRKRGAGGDPTGASDNDYRDRRIAVPRDQKGEHRGDELGSPRFRHAGGRPPRCARSAPTP